jgi:cytochrome c-type biogenesis protein CcsB
MRRALWILSLVGSLWAGADSLPTPKPGFDWEVAKSIAIQNRGRVKPLDTYAREVVQFVTGRATWNGFTPTELVFSWLTTFDKNWANTPFIKVEYGPLKKEIGLNPSVSYFSPTELKDNTALLQLFQKAQQKQQDKEKLEELDKKAAEVENKLGVVMSILQGEDLTILPNPQSINKSWFPLTGVSFHADQLPYSPIQRNELKVLLKPVLEAYMAGDASAWNRSMPAFASYLRNQLSSGAYPSPSEVTREVHYNSLRPFRWAWIFYFAAFVLLTTAIVTKMRPFTIAGAAAMALAYGVHIYGFAIRCLIAGRPPVTNMYESIIWVTFACITFSLIIWAAYKNMIIPAAATVFAIVGLVLADNLPTVLSPDIHPLEPVLRSNFWLTIHVLTITASYAAFALSLCLGNVVLGNYLFRPEKTQVLQNLTLYMYRAMQIGVVLLAAGTILGGVWADYSWGRFWGWDPKEVWALVALLLYLAVLHGRFTGWFKGFGFAAATVVSFLGVLMAWYGVNFVLGVGLHSYGFGTGGISYVIGYVAAQIGFILAAYIRYAKFQRGHPDAAKASLFPRA